MEVVVDSNRHSAVHNLMNRDHYYPSPKSSDREPRYVGGINMATSTMVSPTTAYPNHPPPPYTHTNPPLSAHPLSGLISPPQSHPPESRRTSDDKDPAHNAHRQSLPSIHEALADPKPSGYAPAPSTTITAAHPFSSYSQPPTPTTRPFGMEPIFQASVDRAAARRPSPPQSVHSYSRPEQNAPPLAPYDIHRHQSLPSIRTALPAQSPTGPRPDIPRHEQEQRAMGMSGYSHPQPPTGQYSGYPTASNPPSASAFSPRSPFNQPRPFPARYASDLPNDYPSKEHLKSGGHESINGDQGYGTVVKRNLNYWDAEMSLRKIVDSSNNLSKVSSALLAETQRNLYHGPGPERLPSLQDCDDMEHQQKMLAEQLEIIRRMVNQNMSEHHMQNPNGKMSAAYEQDEMGQWTDEGKMGYGGQDAKKRRGRAAPPGRCHSCNRAETPEWRRGPDGARTLCNACGLHYAKLTRKMGSKQAQSQTTGSGLRKSMDGSPTRS